MGVYAGTITDGILLNNPATQNPVYIAVTGYVTNGTYTTYGILGQPGFAWTVANQGTVTATGADSTGVALNGGGVVENQESISGSGKIAGFIQGARAGVAIVGGAG